MYSQWGISLPSRDNSAPPTAHGTFALLKPPSERTWHLTWCCLLQVHQGGPVGSGVSGQLGSRCCGCRSADGVVVVGPTVAVWWVLGYSRRGISPTLGDSACAAVRGCVLGYSQWGISLPLAAYSGVAYQFCSTLTEELWRRVPLKLRGQRLLDHLSADLKASGFDVEGESEESEEEVEDVYEEMPMLGASSTTAEAEAFWESTESVAQKEFDLRMWNLLETKDLTRPGPARCLCVMCFVVIEICGGKGGITSSCRKRGIYCGPVIEIQDGWDLLDPNIVLWLLRLSIAGRAWVMILEPPCTTFSLAQRPALRNSHEPEGFDAEVFKTNEGNIFGLLCCIPCLAQWTSGNEYLMEQPAYGHMRFTFWWLLVLHLGGDSIISPWCGYIWLGPVYLKPTVLMVPRRSIFWKKLIKGCTCKKPHVKLEGSLTTLAAAYPEGFCETVGENVKEEMPESVGLVTSG